MRLMASLSATRPVVSVIVPVRDGASFVEGAIRSILDQSVRHLELLVVDDGSHDHSATIAERLGRDDQRVRVIRQPRLGQAAALNYGLELARADLVARMDADDLAIPDRLERQIGFLRDNASVGVLGGATLQIGSGGRPIRAAQYPLDDRLIRRALHDGTPTFCHPAIMFRAELVRNIGGYRAAFEPAEDFDLYLRLGEHTRFANLPNRILAYRFHPRQLSVTRIEQQVLGGWGAHCAARARAAGRAEPFADQPVTMPGLIDLGCSVSLLVNDVIRALAMRAALFATIGELGAGRRLIDEAHLKASTVPLRAEIRACLAAADACVLLAGGQRQRAVASLARAVRANPQWVVAGAWQRMRLAR